MSEAKVTRTTLDNELRERISAIVVAALTAAGFSARPVANGDVMFLAPDLKGEQRWVENKTIIPKVNREGEEPDGQAKIDEFAEKQALAAAKAIERDKESKRKQAERAAKDKAKADAKAKAEAEA